jgi:hypothetical protein
MPRRPGLAQTRQLQQGKLLNADVTQACLHAVVYPVSNDIRYQQQDMNAVVHNPSGRSPLPLCHDHNAICLTSKDVFPAEHRHAQIATTGRVVYASSWYRV